MGQLKLGEAMSMISAGIIKAEELGIRVCISVLDPRGDILAVARMDGALWRTVPISQGKAAASAAWDMPSGDLKDRWDQPVVRALSMMENGRLIPWQGALPIRRSDGSLVGAIGVSGAKPAEDEMVAEHGLRALGNES
ncbi:MAG: heme-binding protein [SAR202 cluster bacterium]|nr:heme-binding protein [SAR202 cluster bacterium]|tara:strand:- start:945 stop:1358 length:414 start_codon:yes stop_codon:yes gene_type:complete